MGYDRSLDKTVWEKEVDISDPYGKAGTKFKFVISVMKYGDGKTKVDIKRLAYGAGKSGTYCKLGRLAKHELRLVLPLIEEAMEVME